ncbi:MAG: hypothetical protein OEN55_12120 [Alphaproteobacteria bacterium]|nr:hypothetical protein [Alphaproteobacteria bacterium]
MGSIKIEHGITECSHVSMLDDYFVNDGELATSVMGDLAITLDGSREDFPDIPLSTVASGLMEAALVVASLAAEGDEETITIPDHEPVLRMERQGGTILVSVTMGGQALTSAMCDMADLFREIGTLHKSVTERLLAENPHLMQSQFFRYHHTGGNYFANKYLIKAQKPVPGNVGGRLSSRPASKPVKQKLRDILPRKLGDDFFVFNPRDSTRRLLLSDVTEDLQAGIVIERSKRRGVFGEAVDIGIRIPSVERIQDEYDVYGMRQMRFKNPEPIGWLTFWRPTYSSLDLEEQGLEVDAIMSDFVNLCLSINEDPEAFRDEVLACLRMARLSAWATMPGSTFLINKALIARTLHDPETDACADIRDLIKIEPYLKEDNKNIVRFCEWLRSVRPELGGI